jgi:hypothetical protein
LGLGLGVFPGLGGCVLLVVLLMLLLVVVVLWMGVAVLMVVLRVG